VAPTFPWRQLLGVPETIATVWWWQLVIALNLVAWFCWRE